MLTAVTGIAELGGAPGVTTSLSTDDYLIARRKHVPRGILTAHPLVIERALGSTVWDVEGRRYLDFVGGIGVLNVGHNHPRVVAAVEAQLRKVSHVAFQVAAYPPYVQLASKLSQMVGGSENYGCLFLTTGVEAVENAIKIARSHTNRTAVIAFRGGFHGRTMLGVSLTGMSHPYRQNFGPFPSDIFHVPYPDDYRGSTTESALADIQSLFATQVAPDRVAAIIIEPVQGDGGFRPAPVAFMRALRKLATEHGIVLICDEIQTGFGRTGCMFGFENSGINPDLVTIAKSLAGGLPLSAVVGRAEIMNAPLPGGLGGTYGGNGLACAAALAVIETFEADRLLDRSLALGKRLRAGLETLQQKHSAIGDVRGVGSMLAIELVRDPVSREPDPDLTQCIIDQARAQGLLVIKCGVFRNVIRFLAPLSTSDAEMDEAIGMLDRAIAAACQSGQD